jgi:uncharacterized protein (DUF427 family)
MTTPETKHSINLARNPCRIQALFRGHVIADTTAAVILKETGYKAVCYFPREDVAMAYLRPSAHKTRCPYKGEASYFTLARDGEIVEDAVWTYEDPLPAMEGIRGLVAFYPNQVEIHRVDEDDTRHDIADIILHTDSGSGRSQQEHWPANVTAPLN